MPGVPSSFHKPQLLRPHIFKTIGVDRCAFLAHMAAYDKEDSDKDPLDDEMDIKNVFKKAGFETQQRVRVLQRQPPASNPPSGLAIGTPTAV